MLDNLLLHLESKLPTTSIWDAAQRPKQKDYCVFCHPQSKFHDVTKRWANDSIGDMQLSNTPPSLAHIFDLKFGPE